LYCSGVGQLYVNTRMQIDVGKIFIETLQPDMLYIFQEKTPNWKGN